MSPATLCRLMAGCVPCKVAGEPHCAVADRPGSKTRSLRNLRGCLKSPPRCKDYEGRVQTSRVIDPIAFSLMLDRLVKSRLFKHPLSEIVIPSRRIQARHIGQLCSIRGKNGGGQSGGEPYRRIGQTAGLSKSRRALRVAPDFALFFSFL